MKQLHMVLNMPQYMFELDMNMPENVWIYDNKQASEYVSYNT